MVIGHSGALTRYHRGTKADLRAGDLIVPGHPSKYGRRKPAACIYMTATLILLCHKSSFSLTLPQQGHWPRRASSA
jgi:Rifampin ADP-ribosyl transferase